MGENAPGCLVDLLGLKYYTAIWGVFHKPGNKDPEKNQPGFNGK